MMTFIVSVFLCLVGAAFFSGIETGMISINRMRLQHAVRSGSRNFKIIRDFLENPDRLLGTTLTGTNICIVTLSVLSAGFVSRQIPGYGEMVSTALVTILVLVFGEYLPKAWFRSRPLERCHYFAGLLLFFDRALFIVSFPVVWLTRWMVPGSENTISHHAPFVTKDDLKQLAQEGEKDGVLSAKERVMIHRVM